MRRYALLVGVDAYADRTIPPLRFAERDAQALARVLAERYGFEVRCLVGEQARREVIIKVLRTGRLSESVAPMESSDQFLFFFAGHGELVGSDYILHPWDGDAGIDLQSITMKAIRRLLGRDVPCGECMCILDACRNLAPAGARGGQALDAQSARDIAAVPQAAPGKLIEVLYGCQEGGRSWEDERLGHGVLSYHLQQVLEGSPPGSFEELADQVSDAMSGWRHGQFQRVGQVPHLYPRPGPGFPTAPHPCPYRTAPPTPPTITRSSAVRITCRMTPRPNCRTIPCSTRPGETHTRGRITTSRRIRRRVGRRAAR